MDLKCNFQFQTQTQPPTITVGELFEAHCQAPAEAARLELTKLKVKPVDDATKYQLVVVRSAQNGDSINFAMTSYLVGPKDINVITLTDGTQDFVVQTPAPLKFEVKSILDPQQKPEMFGPITGLGIVIPMVYWVILGSVLVVALSTITAVLVSRFKRKRMLRRLESLDDGSQPIQQYFTNYRRLQREYAVYSARSTDIQSVEENNYEYLKIVRSVEQSLKIFISRVFRIPAFESTWRVTAKLLDSEHDSLYSIMGDDLVELGREFQKIGVTKNKIAPKDVVLISEKTRIWIEKADQLHRAIIAKDTQTIKKLRGTK